jgi:hypothetical protein
MTDASRVLGLQQNAARCGPAVDRTAQELKASEAVTTLTIESEYADGHRNLQC